MKRWSKATRKKTNNKSIGIIYEAIKKQAPAELEKDATLKNWIQSVFSPNLFLFLLTFHLLPYTFCPSLLPFTFCLLQLTYYLLPFTFYLLPFTFYLLHLSFTFTFYLLPFNVYLLPFTIYFLPFNLNILPFTTLKSLVERVFSPNFFLFPNT